MVPMAPSSTRMRSRATRRSFSSAGEMGTDMETDSGLLPLPEGERGGVRGFRCLTLKRAQDLLQHALKIAHHVVVPETKDEIAARFQISGSSRILFGARGMLSAIKLNYELRVGAAE